MQCNYYVGFPDNLFFCLVCWLAWKKKVNNVWDSGKQFMAQFSYKHAEWITPGNFLEAKFDSPLRIKVTGFKCFQGSHAFAMFAHKNITGTRGMLMTFYQTLCIMLPACLLALYGSTMQCTSTLRWFLDNFLFCLVCQLPWNYTLSTVHPLISEMVGTNPISYVWNFWICEIL